MPETHLKFHSANGKRWILVVEDEAINQEILRLILQESYDVLMAGTGAEAVRMVRRWRASPSALSTLSPSPTRSRR